MQPILTFLFTDIEGSTRRWDSHRDAMSAALARHDELLAAAIAGNGGQVFVSGAVAALLTAPPPSGASLRDRGGWRPNNLPIRLMDLGPLDLPCAGQ